jgi:hypothetical protein
MAAGCNHERNQVINPKGSVGMPANVESMFSVRQMPWHREGTILSGYPGSWAEARTLAGLDWDPISTEVYACTGINPDGYEEVYEQVKGWKAVSRSDTGTVLSINKDSYTVINHREMGEIVEAVLPSPTSNGKPPEYSTAAEPSGA